MDQLPSYSGSQNTYVAEGFGGEAKQPLPRTLRVAKRGALPNDCHIIDTATGAVLYTFELRSVLAPNVILRGTSEINFTANGTASRRSDSSKIEMTVHDRHFLFLANGHKSRGHNYLSQASPGERLTWHHKASRFDLECRNEAGTVLASLSGPHWMQSREAIITLMAPEVAHGGMAMDEIVLGALTEVSM